MAKRRTKIAATYFLTIIISLVVIGGAAYFGITKYLSSTSNSNDNVIKPVENTSPVSGADYAPTAADCQTLLAIYEPEKRLTAACFMLVRFAATENQIVLCPMQSDICTELDGKSNTLYEFYRIGGSTEAVKAVEKATGIKIDRYIKFNRDSFTLFSNYMGNISYDVPYNLIYENPETGESTVIKEGEQILDAVSLRKVLTYPLYSGGEEYRAKVVGSIAASLINSGATGILHDAMDSVFTDVINSDIETNITRYDYDEKVTAMKYVIEKNRSPAQLIIPSGSYNENNCYVLEDSFLNALAARFTAEE